MIKNHLVDKQLSVGQEAKLVDRISGSLRDSGKKEQERQTKVIFSIEQNEKIHYAGNIVNVNQPYLSKYHEVHSELPDYLPIQKTKYCNGRFYVVSDEAVDDLLKKKHYIDLEFLEDYAIGYHLSDELKKTIKHLASDMYFKDMQT